jgi:hypothetical protein
MQKRRGECLLSFSAPFYFAVCWFLHSRCSEAFSQSPKARPAAKAIFKKSSSELLTGEADMKCVKLVQIAGLLAVTAMLVGGAGAAFAQTVGTATQTAPAPSSMKTIGAPSAAAKPEIVPWRFAVRCMPAPQARLHMLRPMHTSVPLAAIAPIRLATEASGTGEACASLSNSYGLRFT